MELSRQLEVDAGRETVRVSLESQDYMELIIVGQGSLKGKELPRQLPQKLLLNAEGE